MPAAENTTRFPFTEARIRDWPTPEVGRVRLKDAGCPGLSVYITPMARVFYFRSRWPASRWRCAWVPGPP